MGLTILWWVKEKNGLSSGAGDGSRQLASAARDGDAVEADRGVADVGILHPTHPRHRARVF